MDKKKKKNRIREKSLNSLDYPYQVVHVCAHRHVYPGIILGLYFQYFQINSGFESDQHTDSRLKHKKRETPKEKLIFDHSMFPGAQTRFLTINRFPF